MYPLSNVLSASSVSVLQAEIKSLHVRRVALNLCAVKRTHPALVSSVYALKPFVGWKRFLLSAGISYTEINIELEDTVRCWICGFEGQQLSAHLSLKHQCSAAEYRESYPGRPMMSERLRAKRMKRGTPWSHWDVPYTAEYALDRYHEHFLAGHSMNFAALTAIDKTAVSIAIRYSGSHDKALRAIGIDPNTVRQAAVAQFITRKEAITRLKTRQEKGLSLAETDLVREDIALVNFLRREFGSREEGLRAAGIDPEGTGHRVRRYEQHHIEEAIRDARALVKLGFEESRAELAGFVDRHDPMISSVFGSRREFAIRAGVPVYIFLKDRTRQSVVAEGASLRARKAPLNYAYLHEHHWGFYKAALRHFGTFANFLAELAVYPPSAG